MTIEPTDLARALWGASVVEQSTGRRRLPPERELGVSLGISRGVLREHLLSLEVMGFLDRTQGRGTYLGTPDPAFLTLYLSLAAQLGSVDSAQFGQTRRMLEMAVVEQAAVIATPEEVAALRSHVDKMVAATKRGDVDAATAADFSFHREMFEIVDNPIFNILHDGLRHVLRDEVAMRRARALEVVRTTDDFITDHVHYEIADALHDNDIDAARLAMQRHFDVWDDMVAEA